METASVSTLLPEELTIDDCHGDQDIYDLKVKAREKVIEAVEHIEGEGWVLVKDEGDCALSYKKVEGESINMTLRTFTLDSPMDKAMEKMLDTEMAMKSNDRLKVNEIVEEIDENTVFIKREISGNMVISNRDMSLFQHVIELTDGSKLIVSFSEPHEKIPEKSGVVRADFILSYLHVKSISETTTSVAYLVHFDPKGSLPTSFVNMAQNKQHESVIKFKEFLEKEDTS